MDKKEIIAFFDNLADSWDAAQVRNDEVIGLILDIGGVFENTEVLDVGCGTGVLFPDYLGRKVKSVVGIDISEKMVSIAKEKFPQCNFICGDAEGYAFKNKFDVIMIYNAFPHFTDSRALLNNLTSALKVGGRLTVAHGISMSEVEKCHSGKAKNVSLPLPSKEVLSGMMSDCLRVDVSVSNENMYVVSGIKAG